MKSDFIFVRILPLAVLLGTAANCARTPSPPPPPSPDGGRPQRVVALLDYVAADYRGAVQSGTVVNDEEYTEQLKFAGDAARLAAGLAPAGDPMVAAVAAVAERVRERAAPEEVAREARLARGQVVTRFGLDTTPARRPDLARAQALFAQNCAACHGTAGDARTERARTLSPPPANFHDPARLSDLSPYRVYNTLTFGVPGTAMASFASLAPEDRWNLAFYVFRLGHEGQAAAGPVTVGLPDLAGHSDAELLAQLRTAGQERPEAALAWARREAPFQEPAGSVGAVRVALGAAVRTFEEGGAERADGMLVDAYLQGFEPLEGRLRARDAAATAAVESAFHELRAAVERGDRAEVQARAAVLDRRLGALEEGASRTATVPFLGAMLILLREGVEAALLIAAMLAGVRRLNRPEAARVIHLGWLAALPAGAATWLLFERVLRWGAAERELMEAGVALLAAAVLFSMSFWMISKVEARRWMEYLRRGLERSLEARDLRLLGGLAFLAVYREAAETVLFTQALVLEAGGQRAQVLAGAGVGLLAVLGVGWLLTRAVTRLPLAPFFAASSLLLCLLAISFAGSGIYELVSAGLLRPRPVDLPAVPWMGIHPDWSVLLVQLTILSVIAAAAVAAVRSRQQPQPSASPASRR